MNGEPTIEPAIEPDLAAALLRKENARFARRISQLDATLQQVEQIRDTNARLLKRIMADLEIEQARSHDLLLNVLPQSIIDRLNAGEGLIADRYEDVAVVFSDFVGFTEISSRLPVDELVSSLNGLFSAFDAACAALGVEKIKTIGDAYMAAAGLPGTRPDHVQAAAELALAMRATVRDAGEPWQVRIGLHSGPVVAGVIGTNKFAYDLWGDAVNVASRLETTARSGGSRSRRRSPRRLATPSSSKGAGRSNSRARARPMRTSCSGARVDRSACRSRRGVV
jgi:adenylate cyclase